MSKAWLQFFSHAIIMKLFTDQSKVSALPSGYYTFTTLLIINCLCNMKYLSFWNNYSSINLNVKFWQMSQTSPPRLHMHVWTKSVVLYYRLPITVFFLVHKNLGNFYSDFYPEIKPHISATREKEGNVDTSMYAL